MPSHCGAGSQPLRTLEGEGAPPPPTPSNYKGSPRIFIGFAKILHRIYRILLGQFEFLSIKFTRRDLTSLPAVVING